jgi:hypothetical protein
MPRGRAKLHDVTVNANAAYLYLTVDGASYRIRWEDCSRRLCTATAAERASMEVSPAGYGIHWPLIDEDLAVDPLLKQAESLVAEVA